LSLVRGRIGRTVERGTLARPMTRFKERAGTGQA